MIIDYGSTKKENETSAEKRDRVFVPVCLSICVRDWACQTVACEKEENLHTLQSGKFTSKNSDCTV